jgi:soluble lytic murein transglycosylase-like protein
MEDFSTLSARRALAAKYASRYSLDTALVCAVIEQESSWNPWSVRYEPAFYAHFIIALDLPATESRSRAFSWGLMQTMGQSIREIGFKGQFLSSLCDPDIGVDWGCNLLRRKFDMCGGDLRSGLLLWNGGQNSSYPEQVLARTKTYEISI